MDCVIKSPFRLTREGRDVEFIAHSNEDGTYLINQEKDVNHQPYVSYVYWLEQNLEIWYINEWIRSTGWDMGRTARLITPKMARFLTLALDTRVNASDVEHYLVSENVGMKVRRNWFGNCEFGHREKPSSIRKLIDEADWLDTKVGADDNIIAEEMTKQLKAFNAKGQVVYNRPLWDVLSELAD